MFKWIGIALIAGVIYMISTGNMGGSRDATKNYFDVRTNKANTSNVEAKPNLLHALIKDNPFKSKK